MPSIKAIAEKRELLNSLAPFPARLKELKREADMLDFAYSQLRLYGSALTPKGVRGILVGNMVYSATVFEHRLVNAHRKLLSRLEIWLRVKHEMDSSMLRECYAVLTGTEGQGSPPAYRKGAPLLYHLDYVPGDSDQIIEGLNEAFSAVKRAEKLGQYKDCCEKAAAMHTAIVMVYPYPDGLTELTARTAMQYELLRAGYFPVDIGATEQDYNKLTSIAIKTGDTAKLSALLRKAVYKKLCYLIDEASSA